MLIFSVQLFLFVPQGSMYEIGTDKFRRKKCIKRCKVRCIFCIIRIIP